jgi:hypothetical protein
MTHDWSVVSGERVAAVFGERIIKLAHRDQTPRTSRNEIGHLHTTF